MNEDKKLKKIIVSMWDCIENHLQEQNIIKAGIFEVEMHYLMFQTFSLLTMCLKTRRAFKTA